MSDMEQNTNDRTALDRTVLERTASVKTASDSRELPRGRVRLSLRLQAVADFVEQGSRIADIGTDHGYVPIYLAQTGRAVSAIAMDVRRGPLERAAEHIREYGEREGQSFSCPVKTRLSDGLKALEPGEADTVIIAGMGGELEIRILEEGRHVWDSVKHWILSPQSDLHKVRLYLEENGFVIMDETMVRDEGKYYTIMSVARGTMKYSRPTWYRYGKIPIGRKDCILKEYLDREAVRVQGILETLNGRGTDHATEGQKKAAEALTDEWNLIKEAQDEMQ